MCSGLGEGHLFSCLVLGCLFDGAAYVRCYSSYASVTNKMKI